MFAIARKVVLGQRKNKEELPRSSDYVNSIKMDVFGNRPVQKTDREEGVLCLFRVRLNEVKWGLVESRIGQSGIMLGLVVVDKWHRLVG